VPLNTALGEPDTFNSRVRKLRKVKTFEVRNGSSFVVAIVC